MTECQGEPVRLLTLALQQETVGLLFGKSPENNIIREEMRIRHP